MCVRPPTRRPAPCGRTRPAWRGLLTGTVQDLKALLKGLTVLGDIRGTVKTTGVIPLYSLGVILHEITFSTAIGDGTGDAR